MAREPTLLSVATPMHDEEDTAAQFHARVVAALDGIPFELVIVDDGSRDGTNAALQALAAADPRVKVVTLSRNFGHQAALTAALGRVRAQQRRQRRHLHGEVRARQGPGAVALELRPLACSARKLSFDVFSSRRRTR